MKMIAVYLGALLQYLLRPEVKANVPQVPAENQDVGKSLNWKLGAGGNLEDAVAKEE